MKRFWKRLPGGIWLPWPILLDKDLFRNEYRILTGMSIGYSSICVHKQYNVSDDSPQEYTGHHTSKDTAFQIAWWILLIDSGR
jgi:hypothetical protein